jgi:hypothetical protein
MQNRAAPATFEQLNGSWKYFTERAVATMDAIHVVPLRGKPTI